MLWCIRKIKFNKFLFFKSLTMDSNPVDNVIKEGSAHITVPVGSHVFYNPVQEFNRDLSIAVLRVFSKRYKEALDSKFDILEALSATGLRSIRYAKEIPGVSQIVANDISENAVKIIKNNIEHNNVSHIVHTNCGDAAELMFKHRNNRFAAVDLDPYGSPTNFLDSAIQSVSDGGLLLITATDMAVLCGNTPNTCYVKYGAVSLRNKACHEMALRILLQCIESHANRYRRYIIPLLSVSADFYIRVFVQIFTGSEICKYTTSKLSMVYQCCGCESLTLQPLGRVTVNEKGNKKFGIPTGPAVHELCKHCESKHQMGGPIWSASIHDEVFVNSLLEHISTDCESLNTQRRLQGVISMIREELFEVPLYYTIDKLCNTVHATSISMTAFRSAILNGGYMVSYSHACRTSVKTNAPMTFLWDIIRAWVKENPISKKHLERDFPGNTILKQAMTHEIDFNLRQDAIPLSREMKLTRFQVNPTAFWGPGCRSVVNNSSNSQKLQSKRKRNEDHSETDKKHLKEDSTN